MLLVRGMLRVSASRTMSRISFILVLTLTDSHSDYTPVLVGEAVAFSVSITGSPDGSSSSMLQLGPRHTSPYQFLLSADALASLIYYVNLFPRLESVPPDRGSARRWFDSEAYSWEPRISTIRHLVQVDEYCHWNTPS
jgi:hypothetical protein